MIADRWCPSPNVEPRRGERAPDMIILHYTGMRSAEDACNWLCNPASRVSCHYLVDDDGRITAMVDERLRAWHAGVSFWQGDTDINSRSIGIEIHNPGHSMGYPDFPPAQMQAVAALCRDITARHAIAPQLVLAHSDVAPERKIDPGEKFDWKWLASQGTGFWIEPHPVEPGPELRMGDEGPLVAQLRRSLAEYGYNLAPTGPYDQQTASCVTAFQRHFRQQKVDGIADVSTVRTLDRLLAARNGQ